MDVIPILLQNRAIEGVAGSVFSGKLKTTLNVLQKIELQSERWRNG